MTDELHETLRRIYIDAREGATAPEKAKAGLAAVYEAGVRAGSVLGDRDALREKIARAELVRRMGFFAPQANDETRAEAFAVADAVLDVLYGGDGSSSNTERSE